MDTIIAYCGLVCTDCPAYIATQADDHAALEQVAAQWREEYNAPDVTVESVICDGCVTADGRHCGHWFDCEIRACGMERGVVNCAYCTDLRPPRRVRKAGGLLRLRAGRQGHTGRDQAGPLRWRSLPQIVKPAGGSFYALQ